MPKAPRYIAQDDGSLLDTKTKSTILLTEFEAKQSGRIPVITFIGEDGKKCKIARWMIDETKFSFGPIKPQKKAAPPPRTALALAAPAPPANTIAMTREELLTIHNALQSAADHTLRRLVEGMRS